MQRATDSRAHGRTRAPGPRAAHGRAHAAGGASRGRRRRRGFVPIAAAVGVLAATSFLTAPRPLAAQIAFGVQANVASEMDVGIGGRVLGNIPGSNLEAVGSFDIYFPDGPRDFWELNGNLFYHFHLSGTPNVLPYAGGGLNIARSSNGQGRTEPGLNLGGGVRFPTRSDITPFVELRGVISDFDQLVATFGLLFGPGGGG